MPKNVAEGQAICPVFGQCGGCQHQNISYPEELKLKEKALADLLIERLGALSFDILPIVPSPEIYHYRSRLDLKLKKTRSGTIHIGFSPDGKAPVIEIDACPIAMESISAFIPQLRQEASRMLPSKYKMANLTVRCGEDGRVHWGGIGKRSTRLFVDDYFSVSLCGVKIFYSLDTFFQANLSILPKVMDILRAMPIWSKEAVFFDLYGGVGLFGLCVHDRVKRVVNIESNVHAVKIAKHNIEVNRLSNVEVLEGRVEDVLPKLLETVEGENIVMVDPPRAGLSIASVELLNSLSYVKHLIYLSCDPESLASNMADLAKGSWKIISVQPFDFFPRTRHLETLVVFSR